MRLNVLFLVLIACSVAFFMTATMSDICLLYTSDAADDLLCVDLGGRRIIKKKKNKKNTLKDKKQRHNIVLSSLSDSTKDTQNNHNEHRQIPEQNYTYYR